MNREFRHKGIDIDITALGKFEAQIGDVIVSKPSLEEVKKAIDAELKATKKKKKLALPVVGVLADDRRWHVDDVLEMGSGFLTGVSRTDGSWTFDGLPAGKKLKDIVADTPSNREALKRVIDARMQLRAAEGALDELELNLRDGSYVPGAWNGGRISAEQYEGVIAKLEKTYAKSAGSK